MPQRKTTQSSRNTKRKRHTKKATRKQPMRRRILSGGSTGCEQAATIMEPGFTITSHLKDKYAGGLTIPSSRALLSGSMPSCNKGSHP
jgi:hypothetical protein